MASLDIGIDLGTSKVIGVDSSRGIVLREPSVVARDRRNGKILGIGSEIYKMIGRTPPHIEVIRPLQDGVVSDYKMTEVLIKYVIQKITSSQLVKPRVIICVPSSITEVESQAVINAAVAAGARKVYLIEEPVAAAIGAGIDLSKPNGNMIIDIGGGTSDIAVLSLYGIVCKTSLKTAGYKFDAELIRYIRSEYNLLIGDKMAEQIKMDIGSVGGYEENPVFSVKGRDLISGLPKKISVHRSETAQALAEPAELIAQAVQQVLERTPPELVGDIRDNGLILTGGGSLLNGLDRLLEKRTGVHTVIATDPVDCVAYGTAKSFDYLDKLYDGFVQKATHTH